ncbi:hypothetical protein [Oceanitalea stevensii]|uniref:Uncharacterized protein n=1 Tax=Oceanitalea stevensii TaxID=2763072 RepID=A0ABR8YXF0_9MICO|nr:hypothetical protein [Oceanitalea stevensii]MBD8060711.1 hypothetical protein [Oceanitalea stevensii]
MDISPTTAQRINRAAWTMAVLGTVVGQLHALARFQVHPDDLAASPLARAWAEPATRTLRPLLDWADGWTVYLTYGKVWAPVCVALTAAAYLVYRRRRPGGAERRLWLVTLAAYVTMTLSVVGEYFTPWTDQMFVVGMAAALVIAGSGIALGVLLLRRGFRPRTTAALLVLFLPLMVVISSVTSLGNALLPLVWGWALASRAAVRAERGARPDPGSRTAPVAPRT